MMRNRIDTPELDRIKNKFALRDRLNMENRDSRQDPELFFDSSSTNSSLQNNTLRGLTYPLQLDGNGGISTSYGYDRIGQAIQEVLETRIGERVGNPFLGVRELLFDTLSEDVEEQNIKKQILSAVPYLTEESLNVSLSISEEGTCYITVRYAVDSGGQTITVRTSTS